jgi:muramoyltetrapeptide carboxypeptidase LdcA involved in peptidoglycan recycling
MTITLSPQTEQRLRALAELHNLSVEAVVERLIDREDRGSSPEQTAPRARNLVELFADLPLKGSGIVIERDRSPVRDISV